MCMYSIHLCKNLIDKWICLHSLVREAHRRPQWWVCKQNTTRRLLLALIVLRHTMDQVEKLVTQSQLPSWIWGVRCLDAGFDIHCWELSMNFIIMYSRWILILYSTRLIINTFDKPIHKVYNYTKHIMNRNASLWRATVKSYGHCICPSILGDLVTFPSYKFAWHVS